MVFSASVGRFMSCFYSLLLRVFENSSGGVGNMNMLEEVYSEVGKFGR